MRVRLRWLWFMQFARERKSSATLTQFYLKSCQTHHEMKTERWKERGSTHFDDVNGWSTTQSTGGGRRTLDRDERESGRCRISGRLPIEKRNVKNSKASGYFAGPTRLSGPHSEEPAKTGRQQQAVADTETFRVWKGNRTSTKGSPVAESFGGFRSPHAIPW